MKVFVAIAVLLTFVQAGYYEGLESVHDKDPEYVPKKFIEVTSIASTNADMCAKGISSTSERRNLQDSVLLGKIVDVELCPDCCSGIIY